MQHLFIHLYGIPKTNYVAPEEKFLPKGRHTLEAQGKLEVTQPWVVMIAVPFATGKAFPSAHFLANGRGMRAGGFLSHPRIHQ